jgi:hypothetical protein
MWANRKENSQEQGALTRPAIQRHSYANKNGLGADGAEKKQLLVRPPDEIMASFLRERLEPSKDFFGRT